MKDCVNTKIEQFDALTGLRGFAALWVVMAHFHKEINLLLPASASFDWLIGAGGNAVPIFFILSGFILLHTNGRRLSTFSWKEYARFIGLRLARIYPAYLAAIGIMLVFVTGATLRGIQHNVTAYPLNWLPAEILMVHCWIRMPLGFSGWNYPDWSVSAEWFAYLFIFPLAVWMLKKTARFKDYAFIILALMICVLEPSIRSEWKLSMVILLFLLGAFLWEIRRRQLAVHKQLPSHFDSIGVLMLLVVLAYAGRFGSLIYPAGILIGASLLILGLSRPDGFMSRLMAASPCVFLGEISYSIYLIHGIVQRLLKITLPASKFQAAPVSERVGIVLISWAAVLLSATLLYYAVEHPMREWLRRRFLKSQTPSPTTAN